MSHRIALLQWSAAVLATGLYAVIVLAAKWWLYPGWTWRGYLTELKAASALLLFTAGFVFSLFEVYRSKKIKDLTPSIVRNWLLSRHLLLINIVLLTAVLALIVFLRIWGERSAAPKLVTFAIDSNWKHAQSYIATLEVDPLRPELKESFRLFVKVHDASDHDQLKGSQSLREDRRRVLDLLTDSHDPDLVNSLTFAELSKAIYFVEDADERKDVFDQAVAHLQARLAELTSSADRARVLTRLGEMRLATRDYLAAQSDFEHALYLTSWPQLQARLRANLGNIRASTGDLTAALELYKKAEKDYPEGRRAIFHSNFGYMLLLKGELDSATKQVQHALQIDPNDWYSYLNLGLIKERRGDYDDALEDYVVVIKRSENPDSRREARIFAGRCLEFAGRPASEYLVYYLEADGRSSSAAQVRRVQASAQEQSALYASMASHLKSTNTHGIESHIKWFAEKAKVQVSP